MRIPTTLLLAAASTLSVSSVAQSSLTEQARPPHVVVVLADDMGFGDPGFNNPASGIPTPHLDALAEGGMRFTDAHAPGSVCVPSRYGLLTGRYPARRRRIQPGREAVIRDGTPTLASMLRSAGYRTAMVGKWHLGFDDAADLDYDAPLRGGPLDRGFDSWFGIPASLDIPPYYFVRDRDVVAPPTGHIGARNSPEWTKIQGAFWRAGGLAPGFVHHEVLPRFRDEAVQVIEHHGRSEASDRPLFLYVALPAPHTPWLPDREFLGRSSAGSYGDFAAQVDSVLGDIDAALARAGMKDDTLFVFTSDNGPVWYPADVARFEHAATGPFRGMKGDAWEGGHRMPFVVRWPGRVAPGTSSERTVCFTDLFRTLAAASGAKLPRTVAPDSVSFMAELTGGEPSAPRPATVLKAGATVVRDGDWKLIRHRGSGGFSKPRGGPATEPPGQLYDLATDPGETTNRYAEQPDRVAKLERIARRTAPPNVIVILADDMGYGDSSVYDGWLETPGLERMAREGLVFTDFHTSGVVCSPTRAGLLTGRYQQRAGLAEVVNADPKIDAHHRGMQDVEFTLPEALRAGGYTSALFGKWHLGYKPEFNPLRHGFDEFVGFVSGNIDYHSHRDRMNVPDWWQGSERVPEAGYLTTTITDHAVEFIERRADRPFYLHVAHGAVHTPIQDPDSPVQRGPDRGTTKDPRPKRDVIAGMMRELDNSVTRILDVVRREGLAGRTLVLFLSDNGGAAHMKNDPLRGRKGTVWEGGHRVPALAWWPGKIRAGSRSDALCSSLDIMPTALELAGLDLPTERPLDGESLERTLLGTAEEQEPRQLFWNGKAMREGRWKLVLQNKTARLFDLANDLGEQDDLSARHPERVAAMQAALAAWRSNVQRGATQQPR